MPKVFNWQLGREMDYPYPEAHPDRQLAFVFNLNRCIGCQTCTMSCKSTWTFSEGQEYMWWNNVETKPYGGYPQHWDAKALSLLGPQSGWDRSQASKEAPYGVFQGQTLFEKAAVSAEASGQRALGYVPTDKEWRFPNIYEDTGGSSTPSPFPKDGAVLPEHPLFFFYLPRICNHCTYPACLAGCPRSAIYKRKEDGIVLLDQKRCRAYRKCVEQCPYKKVMYRGTTGISEKCIACYPRVEQGLVPRCVAACVGKIRLAGWITDPESPIHYLVREEKVALPLFPQFGLGPNVYYIPPRWVPRPYLYQMFGPGVDAAIEKYTKPSPKLLGVLQLFGVTQQIISAFDVRSDHAIGYDERQKEIIRVPIEEPVIVRPEKHLNTT
jgi:nitrate reductase beta subunit